MYLQVVLPDLAVEGPLADAEDLGGLLAIALRPGQRVRDRLLLELVERDARQAGGRCAGARQLPALGDLRRQVRDVDLVAGRTSRPSSGSRS